MKKLAFIFGLPRGGTTLVWGLLNDCENTFAIRKDRNTSESAIYVNKKNPKILKAKIVKFIFIELFYL